MSSLRCRLGWLRAKVCSGMEIAGLLLMAVFLSAFWIGGIGTGVILFIDWMRK